MNNIAFWKRISIKFLSEVCLYDIKNINGNNHKISNTIDFVILLVYMAITIAIIIKNQFSSLSYGIILISTIRMMLKHAKKITPSKCDSNNNDDKTLVSVAELVLTIIFSVSAIIYSILFFAIDDYTKLWVLILFIIYYFFNFILEVFDILISLFNASPIVFSQNRREEDE